MDGGRPEAGLGTSDQRPDQHRAEAEDEGQIYPTRDELYVSLLGKSQTFHNRQRVGDIMARANNDVRQLNPMMNPAAALIIESIMAIIVLGGLGSVPGTLADTRVPAVPVVMPAFLPPIRMLALFLPIFSVTPLAILTRF